MDPAALGILLSGVAALLGALGALYHTIKKDRLQIEAKQDALEAEVINLRIRVGQLEWENSILKEQLKEARRGRTG